MNTIERDILAGRLPLAPTCEAPAPQHLQRADAPPTHSVTTDGPRLFVAPVDDVDECANLVQLSRQRTRPEVFEVDADVVYRVWEGRAEEHEDVILLDSNPRVAATVRLTDAGRGLLVLTRGAVRVYRLPDDDTAEVAQPPIAEWSVRTGLAGWAVAEAHGLAVGTPWERLAAVGLLLRLGTEGDARATLATLRGWLSTVEDPGRRAAVADALDACAECDDDLAALIEGADDRPETVDEDQAEKAAARLRRRRDDLESFVVALRGNPGVASVRAALEAIDARVAAHRAVLEDALVEDEHPRWTEVACRDPDAWWGEEMV